MDQEGQTHDPERELVIQQAGAKLREQIEQTRSMGTVIGRKTALDTLIHQAKDAEKDAGHLFDLFRSMSSNTKIRKFTDIMALKAEEIGYEDVAEELTTQQKFDPLQRYQEYSQREPKSAFSYLVHAIDTASLVITDKEKEPRTIVVSPSTIEAGLEGDDALSAHNTRKNIQHLFGLETNSLAQFGVEARVEYHDAPKTSIPAGRKGIPYLTVTISGIPQQR